MSEVDEVGTQPEVDVEEVEQAEGADTPEAQAEPEPFLRVNERTVYKTREDALKAYSEAGERIKQLSPYEKELGKYGIKDARTAASLIEELRTLRAQQAEAAKKATEKPQADSPKLSKEEQEIRDYLKKVYPEIGVASKSEIAELKEALASLQKERESASQSEYESAIEDGEAKVSSWLSEAKIADPTGAKMRLMGSVLKDWINSDQDLIDRFYRSASSREKLLREGFDMAIGEIGWKGEAATPANPAAAYAAAKGKQLQSNKKLPADSAASKGAPEKPKSNRTKDPIGALGSKAWEVFSKRSSGV